MGSGPSNLSSVQPQAPPQPETFSHTFPSDTTFNNNNTASGIGQDVKDTTTQEPPLPSSSTTTTSSPSSSDETSNTQRKPSTPSKTKIHTLSGPALVEYKCRKRKKAWSACVGTFYQRFSSGQVLAEEQPDCDDAFEAYRRCYLKGLLKERQKQGIQDPPKEGTLLAEFLQEQKQEPKATR